MVDAGRVGGAFEDGVDAGEGFGDGALDGRREGIGKGEGMCADGEEEGALWDSRVKILAETQEEMPRVFSAAARRAGAPLM